MHNRLDNNLKIHAIVGDFLIEHPEMRYIQALWALGIINNEDRFYEEPSITLDKIKSL